MRRLLAAARAATCFAPQFAFRRENKRTRDSDSLAPRCVSQDDGCDAASHGPALPGAGPGGKTGHDGCPCRRAVGGEAV